MVGEAVARGGSGRPTRSGPASRTMRRFTVAVRTSGLKLLDVAVADFVGEFEFEGLVVEAAPAKAQLRVDGVAEMEDLAIDPDAGIGADSDLDGEGFEEGGDGVL